MKENEGRTGLVWTFVLIAFIALLFLFAVKMLPELRDRFIGGTVTISVLSKVVIILILICFLGVSLVLLAWFSPRGLEIEQEIMREVGEAEVEEGGEEVLIAEIVDEAEVKPTKEKKTKPKKDLLSKYRIIEYPTKVEDGIFGDSFVKVSSDTLLKVRTKIAEESEI